MAVGLPRANQLFGKGKAQMGSVLILERGIYAASPFKAMAALKRAKARAPPANEGAAARA